MKNLIAMALLCFIGTAASAQAKRLIVTNNTSCMVYFEIVTSSTTSPCTPAAVSSFIAFPPGTTVYDYTTVPGLPATPKYILGARNYFAPTTCGTYPVYPVGEPCSSFPLMAALRWLTPNCAVCGSGNAQWVPAPGLGGDAQLHFF